MPTAPNDVYNNGSTVTTTITGATGGNFENLVPNPTPAVTTIVDSIDTTGLTLTATGTVVEGGQITDTVATPQPVFACALGGEYGTTLFALCAPGTHPDEVRGKAAGGIYTVNVDVPHAGWP